MRRLLAIVSLAGLALAPAAHATWSIVLTDSRTGEVAIGSATCLEGFDLLAGSPVLVVAKGGAAAQSLVDTTGENRRTIRDGLVAGTSPQNILRTLGLDPSFDSRQYGIVDTTARSITYTGSGAGAYAGGRTGSLGTMSYALQGNVLTGATVLDAAEHELLSSGIDLPGRLMQAMLAAAEQGGDGRCSCRFSEPMACGAPPPGFKKSAHVGYLVGARLGDTDGGCDAVTGCASGDYFLNLNVAFQAGDDLDPVLQLRQEFLAWRQALVDHADHHRSTMVFANASLPADGVSRTVARVQLRDWRGASLSSTPALDVTLDPGSTASAQIGQVSPLGGGAYAVVVTAGSSPGVARFRVVADDGRRPVLLAPLPQLELLP
jgi:hypothetical protein